MTGTSLAAVPHLVSAEGTHPSTIAFVLSTASELTIELATPQWCRSPVSGERYATQWKAVARIGDVRPVGLGSRAAAG
jgi:hypothetical protein